MKTEHCLTGQYLHWTKNRAPLSAGGASTGCRPGITFSRSPGWKPAEDPWAAVLKETGGEEPVEDPGLPWRRKV